MFFAKTADAQQCERHLGPKLPFQVAGFAARQHTSSCRNVKSSGRWCVLAKLLVLLPAGGGSELVCFLQEPPTHRGHCVHCGGLNLRGGQGARTVTAQPHLCCMHHELMPSIVDAGGAAVCQALSNSRGKLPSLALDYVDAYLQQGVSLHD
jgi:hypothetical protein